MQIMIWLFTFGGIFFFIVGTVGILRMPDVFSRLHAATKCDTLGVLLIVSAILVSEGINPGTLKLLFVMGFLWVTSPTAASVIGSAEVHRREREKTSQSLNRGRKS